MKGCASKYFEIVKGGGWGRRGVYIPWPLDPCRRAPCACGSGLLLPLLNGEKFPTK